MRSFVFITSFLLLVSCLPEDEGRVFNEQFGGAIAAVDIIGGKKDSSNSYPYVLSLNHCSGFIVAENLFVTAAHCVVKDNFNFSKRRVSLSNKVTPTSSSRKALNYRNIYKHKLYQNGGSILADIAFIEIQSSFSKIFSIKKIPRIFLPQLTQPPGTLFTKQNILAIGYGNVKERPREDTPSSSRRFVDLSLIKIFEEFKNTSGQWMLRRLSFDKLSRYFPQVITLSSYKKDTCRGDSGGPVMLRVNGNLFYLGSTVGGEKRCGKGKTAGYYRLVGTAICEVDKRVLELLQIDQSVCDKKNILSVFDLDFTVDEIEEIKMFKR
ncbi:MAG: trypsin-like serine protease [Bdellovibrionales bacterium]